jgi:hypothetical protein
MRWVGESQKYIVAPSGLKARLLLIATEGSGRRSSDRSVFNR